MLSRMTSSPLRAAWNARALAGRSRSINDGFPPIGRLDGLARTAEGPLPMRLKTDPKARLSPTHPRMWFAEGYRVVSALGSHNRSYVK